MNQKELKNSLSKKIESENNNIKFSGLISAIEFFSQRFELDQLISFAFEFSDSLLKPDKMVLWYHKAESYIIHSSKEYDIPFSFDYYEKYNQIVYFHAGLMYEKQVTTLLPPDIQSIYQPDFCIPLIMDKSFFGLIALKRNEKNPFTPEDEIIATALMNLLSTALTNYDSYKLLETTKAKLDEKIFNLFAINHSTKALLSQLSLSGLCELAISVFSELTQSSFTTFFIKDQISENFQLMSYKHVSQYDLNLDITLFPDKDNLLLLPVVVDMTKPKSAELFSSLFFNGKEIIKKINPQYIILLKKDNQLLGFVTLGAKVNDTHYENSIFELVESLASATYIAISNAIHIEKIEAQKNIINLKFKELQRLNQLMKNMNSAQTYDQVITLVMNTLNISFGIDMGFLALYDAENKQFQIANSVNMKKTFKKFKVSNDLLPLFSGEIILKYEENEATTFFGASAEKAYTKPVNGLILLPIFIKNVDIELIGCIALLNKRSAVLISDEDLVSYDSIANHVAPVIHQLLYADSIKNLYKPDYSELFIKKISQQITEAADFSLDLYVAHISHKSPVCFTELPIVSDLNLRFKNIYPVDKRTVFLYTNDATIIDELELFMSANPEYEMKVYSNLKDFNNLQSFIELFQ